MNKKVWLVTGAGRGMGADIAKAALAAGHAVVATGRNIDAVSKALGRASDLLSVALVTIANEKHPPRRFIAGADAIATAEQKIADLKAQIEAHRELSTSLAFD